MALVQINLVPDKIRSGETLRVIVLVGVVSLFLPVLFWAYRYQAVRAERVAVEKELQGLKDELASPQLKQVVAEVEQFTRDEADLAAKRSVLDQLRKRQVMILRLLDLMPDLLPADSRLRSMNVTDAGATKHVELGVVNRTNDAVAEVYNNLESSSLIGKLQMTEGPSPVVVGGRNMVRATYTFDLQDVP